MEIRQAPLDWLLQGEPWVVYRTRLDLLGQGEGEAEVRQARAAMTAAQPVQKLVAELAGWPGEVISSHKSAGQQYHKLTFLADLGLTAGDPGMERVVERIREHQSAEGPFQLPVNIPKHFGGSGEDQWAWALCDAPVIGQALVSLGFRDDPGVQAGVQYLAGLVRENGWPCAVSKELGKFRGPGRKDDPCPYATLVMLKLLGAAGGWGDSPACRTGAETLLSLWAASQEKHPYMFFMGNDFRKLKVPFVWYDLLHVLDVLSRCAWLREDERLLEMHRLMQSKADPQGRYRLESVWTAWKEWEFGQKKEPSRWLSLLAWRITAKFEPAAVGGAVQAA